MTLRLDEDLGLEHRQNGQSAAALLWWKNTPDLPGKKLGAIGNFSADGPEAAAAILKMAERELASRGCALAVGPMNGNTWRSYRFVTEPGTEHPFFLEPANPAPWPAWWRSAGYETLASYYSTVADDLSQRDPRVESVAVRLRASGISIRPLSLANFDQDLLRIYDISVESFQENFLYTPLLAQDFLDQYRPIQSRVISELVLIAEQAGRPVGYVFTIPDLAQAKRGAAVDTIIVKTLAVRPGRAFAGLGAWLLSEVHRVAREMGFKRAIHALMHESNRSRNLSAHYARTLRRYALMAREISP